MGVTAAFAMDAAALSANLPMPLGDALADAPHEIAAFAYLSRTGTLLGTRTIGSSLPDLVALPIRQIVRHAILLDADRLVMAHNHPSGIAAPSRADIDTTRRLSRALAMFDVRLVDHWIVTRDRWVSLRALGLM
ncbi:JAB domain-containing protein [Sphingomonas sp. AX6]|uniref:JAB domain-containing protein n=1 Tax=Sphingomonas sp. AX6 TaxID=2653171 RepID=UPI0012EF5A7B|nr:JAB domain-containing protein [Sphingomonas sp. AX6]VXC83337.1 conserved hypothetical protein [Sphingomonas sp. AX6]